MFTEEDKKQLTEKGITEEQVMHQLDCFKTGFPFLKLVSAASVGNGILTPGEYEANEYLAAWDEYLAGDHRIVKFVPASGAASRMFKDVFAFVDAPYDVPTTDFEKYFFDNIGKAAFKPTLDATCVRLYGKNVDALVAEGKYKEVVKALLGAEGMNYGQLPKGVLHFHSYGGGARTPVEEHLVEGALYARQQNGKVNIHFTVSPEHKQLFENLVSSIVPKYEEKYGVKYVVSFSEQKSYTDTIAVTPDNEPFRNEDGSLLFRPAGHGALIVNLNDINADVIFIKNIDNVVPDRLKEDTIRYKKLIAGVLVSLQKQIFAYLEELESGVAEDKYREMLSFIENKLLCRNEKTATMSDAELREYIIGKLNRPLRVCGMVRNVGEAGGGPFIAVNPDGSASLQILESSQINVNDPKEKEMFNLGTHFNPVDLVCATTDYKGRPFNLPDYVDPATGFISSKSKNGRELKALELPGLWNGSMSNWNTVFVEVPLTTFNPVKTVNDLYREEHR